MMIFTALLKAKPASVPEVRSILSTLTARAAAETGMISYYAGSSCDDPSSFRVIECYRDRQAWHDHMRSDHVKEALAAFGELLSEPPVTTELDCFAAHPAP